jgi:hypothetical protein
MSVSSPSEFAANEGVKRREPKTQASSLFVFDRTLYCERRVRRLTDQQRITVNSAARKSAVADCSLVAEGIEMFGNELGGFILRGARKRALLGGREAISDLIPA